MSALKRIERLEAQARRRSGPVRVPCGRVLVEVGESVEEAIAREFGDQRPPRLIIRQVVEPSGWCEGASEGGQ